MAFRKTVVSCKGGLVVQFDGQNDIIVKETAIPSATDRIAKTAISPDYIAVNESRRLIAVASFSKSCHQIQIIHRPISGVCKTIACFDAHLEEEDSISWIGWHPGSLYDNHLVCLSSHGTLCMYKIPTSDGEARLQSKLHIRSDFSLECRSASFISASQGIFQHFTLLVLLESAEILAISPLLPDSPAVFPHQLYEQEAAQLQSRLNDIVGNEFPETEYADAVKQVDLLRVLRTLAGPHPLDTFSGVKVQGPFAVHPEPVEDLLDSAQQIFAVFITHRLTLITSVCLKGRVDVYVLLDDIDTRWDHGKSVSSHPTLYLIDSVKLAGSRLIGASAIAGMETELLVNTPDSTFHLSLSPVAQQLLVHSSDIRVSVDKLNVPVASCGWYNVADVEGSLIVFDGVDQHRVSIPHTLPDLLISLPVPSQAPSPQAGLKGTMEATTAFSLVVSRLASLKTSFDQGRLTVADLQLLHQQLSTLTQHLSNGFKAELERSIERAYFLASINSRHLRVLQTAAISSGLSGASIKGVQERQEQLKARAAVLFARGRSEDRLQPIEQMISEFAELPHSDHTLALHSRLLASLKRRLQ